MGLTSSWLAFGSGLGVLGFLVACFGLWLGWTWLPSGLPLGGAAGCWQAGLLLTALGSLCYELGPRIKVLGPES